MSNIRVALAVGVALVVWPTPGAQAEEIFFPPEQYGLVELTLPQSTGFQLESVLADNPNFEPLHEYSPNDALRQLSQSIGRLDILYPDRGVNNCTASVIAQDYILTNAHCLPGPDQFGPPRRASLLMGYYAGEDGTRRYEVELEPVETNAQLDYSILRVFGRPSDKWGTLPLLVADPPDLSSLLLIHHPGGKQKHVTRGGCRSGDPATLRSLVLHTCDTINGSSGAPILAASGKGVIGLHFGGPLSPRPGEYKRGTRIASLAEDSAIIRDLVRREPETPAVAAQPDPSSPLAQAAEMLFWETVKDSKDPRELRAYLEAYPGGAFVVLAEIELAALTPTETPEQPKPPAPAIEIEELRQQMVARTNANVRAGPSTEAQRVGSIARDKTIEVTGKVRGADWYRVAHSGRDAFVHSSLLVPPAVFEPNLEAGIAAFGSEDYEIALRHFQPLAERGIAAAQSKLGYMYGNGLGVSKDEAQAVRWYRRAADQGDVDGQFQLAGMYQWGNSVPQDYVEAVRWYRRAADQGHASAQHELGYMYQLGFGARQDYAAAVRWFRRAADQKHAGAQYSLGYLYHWGLGKRQDYAEALRWYEFAADKGHAAAKRAVAALRPQNQQTPNATAFEPNLETARAAYESRDYSTAFRDFWPLAEDGLHTAQLYLGLMFEQGLGVPEDDAEALRWFRRAAEQGNPVAQNNLGRLYEDGRGVLPNPVRALQWYRRAADQGSAGGQYNLGNMHFFGRGVLRDYTEAARWFRRAADQGLAVAQFNLGHMYEHGLGLKQHDATALRWYRRAADQGHEDSKRRIARLQ